MIYLESPSFDPSFNLALEEYVFDTMPRDQEYFMLWQNEKAVIIGKHQNAYEEVNLPYVKEQEIPVVRRLSGGGAVYHDLGNLNFTYIVDGENPDMSMERFAKPLLLACQTFGIQAEVSGRNDILVNGRKFSGNASYQEDGRIMHHGTILISSDLQEMELALRPASDKFISKGISSVRSRVTNLKDCTLKPLTVSGFAAELKRQVFHGEEPEDHVWTQEELSRVEERKNSRYDTWDWNYGTFPVYEVERSRRIEGCGTVAVQMNVLAGRIEGFRIQGDFLGNGAVEELEDLLMGCPLQEESVGERLRDISLSAYIRGITEKEFLSLLCLN